MTSHHSTETSAYSNSAARTTLAPRHTSTSAHEVMSDLHDELKNPLSFWQEIRVTPMSGTDYVFIPNFVYQAFGGSYTLARFATELSAAFDIEPSRMQLICRSDKPNEDWLYGKTIVEWRAGTISHSHLETIPQNSKYHEFVESMFQYSSALTTQLEH